MNIKQILFDALEKYKNEAITAKLIEDIRSIVWQVLQKHSATMDKIEYDVKKSYNNPRIINIIPKNLYTGLILDGLNVPYCIVEGTNVFSTSKGIYRFINDNFIFEPK